MTTAFVTGTETKPAPGNNSLCHVVRFEVHANGARMRLRAEWEGGTYAEVYRHGSRSPFHAFNMENAAGERRPFTIHDFYLDMLDRCADPEQVSDLINTALAAYPGTLRSDGT